MTAYNTQCVFIAILRRAKNASTMFGKSTKFANICCLRSYAKHNWFLVKVKFRKGHIKTLYGFVELFMLQYSIQLAIK